MKPLDFRLSDHALKRLRERFPMLARNIDALPKPYLKVKFTYDLLGRAVDVTDELKMYDNPIFQEKYKDVPHVFFKVDHILFIGRPLPEPTIVTVVNWNQTRLMNTPRPERSRGGKYPHEILPPPPNQPPGDDSVAVPQPLPPDVCGKGWLPTEVALVVSDA